MASAPRDISAPVVLPEGNDVLIVEYGAEKRTFVAVDALIADAAMKAATTAMQERLFDLSLEADRIDSIDRHGAGRLGRAAIGAALREATGRS